MAERSDASGVPRELGHALGASARAALRGAGSDAGWLARVGDQLGQLDAAGARWLRDVRRHFPHQAEWLEGAARGARLPLPALVRAARAALAEPPRALVAWEGGAGAQLACALPPGAALRQLAPEGRFRSLEWALGWLPTPWLGVNEAGLAVAVSPGARADTHCAAPAALLARDCLERFEAVASALAWCLGRPAAPGAALLLADASGALVGVELRTDTRQVRRPEGGVLALGLEASRAAELAKAVAGVVPDAAALAVALGVAPAALARADARGRRLARGADWSALAQAAAAS